MKNDYRNTPYCSQLEDVDQKKQLLKSEINKVHPKLKNIYTKVKDTNGPYKKKFMEIYNFKCSYCGNSISNINMTLFEVDHYICESSFNSKSKAGEMENLVLSCYDCNRAKGKFLIDCKYSDILNPDLEHITSLFYRDNNYYIQISDDYKDDKHIEAFYNKLKLGSQSRRLDFLLMHMCGFCETIKDKPQYEKLNEILNKLHQKRNLISCK
jgi:5-methylcytosine-specific restriction endonuclease McrA